MTDLRIARAADRDIARAVELLRATRGDRQVRRFLQAYDRALQRLQDFPESGAPRQEIGRDIRIALIWPFLLIHRYDARADCLDVLRILDGRRDPRALTP